MPFVTLGQPNHDTIAGVSADDHHTAAHNLADHAVRAHANLSDAPVDAHHNQAHNGTVHTLDSVTFSQIRLFGH